MFYYSSFKDVLIYFHESVGKSRRRTVYYSVNFAGSEASLNTWIYKTPAESAAYVYCDG